MNISGWNRWSYPEARLDLDRWCRFRKRGYGFSDIHPSGLTFTMDYRTHRISQTVPTAALVNSRGWRSKVAAVLRKMRRELRRHHEIYSGYQT